MGALPTVVVDLNIQADSEMSALRALVNLAETTGKVLDRVRLVEDAAETTLYHRPGKHVCAAVFPVFTTGVSGPIVAFGKVPKDIGYRCSRDDPIDLVTLAAIPPEQAEHFFPFFSNLRAFLAGDANRKRLRELKQAEEVKRILLTIVPQHKGILPEFWTENKKSVNRREVE